MSSYINTTDELNLIFSISYTIDVSKGLYI